MLECHLISLGMFSVLTVNFLRFVLGLNFWFHILAFSYDAEEPAFDALNETADCSFLTDMAVTQSNPSPGSVTAVSSTCCVKFWFGQYSDGVWKMKRDSIPG